MGAAEVSGPANDRDKIEASTDRITQATSVAVVAAALAVWWPAFDLGAYGVIFFQQMLALWAASTAVFLASLTAGRRARGVVALAAGAPHSFAWLLLALAIPEGGPEPWSRGTVLPGYRAHTRRNAFLAALPCE